METLWAEDFMPLVWFKHLWHWLLQISGIYKIMAVHPQLHQCTDTCLLMVCQLNNRICV